MINVEEIKKKIIETIKTDGPRLPVQIAKAVQLSPVFASAILSELVGAKKVKMSHLKYGASSLYVLPGEEQRLEAFVEENMGGMEKNAYKLLKEEKILEDIKQEPAIRVALRSIKDFATPITFEDKMFWKYNFISSEEAREILERRTSGRKEIPQQIEKKIILQEQKPFIKVEEKEQVEEKFPEPVEEIKIESGEPKVKKKKEKAPQDELLKEVKEFLARKEITFVKEIEANKKEVFAVVKINSDFGEVSYLLVAKEKKKLNTGDITMAYQKAINMKMPCYLLFRGEPSKNTLEFLNEHKNLLRVDSL